MHIGLPAGAAKPKLDMRPSMVSISLFLIDFCQKSRVKGMLPSRGGGSAGIFPTELSTGGSVQRINAVRLRQGLC